MRRSRRSTRPASKSTAVRWGLWPRLWATRDGVTRELPPWSDGDDLVDEIEAFLRDVEDGPGSRE